MHFLFREVKNQFVQISVLALEYEKERLVVKDGARCHEKSSRKIVSTPQRNVAEPVFVISLLVYQEVFADHDDATGTDVSWHLDKHVCRAIDWEDVLPDHMVQT